MSSKLSYHAIPLDKGLEGTRDALKSTCLPIPIKSWYQGLQVFDLGDARQPLACCPCVRLLIFLLISLKSGRLRGLCFCFPSQPKPFIAYYHFWSVLEDRRGMPFDYFFVSTPLSRPPRASRIDADPAGILQKYSLSKSNSETCV